MPAKYVLATACAVALNLTAAAAFAGAKDYTFEVAGGRNQERR